ncbi:MULTISPECIES: DUF6684 family protein [Halostella]|uniref:DUF6684 family protein n=1 Tax=Halostella TaxID=1843185 RepID=UPI00108208FF|nr:MULTISPECIES: DUF6684 family protein [Halostella]
MSPTVFDRETLLDLTVNVIPLGILLFFVGAFALFNPYGWDSTYSVLQFGLISTMFVALTALTYYSGKLIAEDEKAREEVADEAE